MNERQRHLLRMVGVALWAATVLTACTVTVNGGVIGGGLGLGLALLLLASAGNTGCIEDADPDAEVESDAEVDAEIGPCLTAPPEEMGVGPCLGVDMDFGPPDSMIGPCLTRPEDDLGPPDARVGPCLEPLPPEMGPSDAEVRDAEPDAPIGPCLDVPPPPMDMGTDEDARVGPCLSPPPPPPPDAGLPPDAGAQVLPTKDAILAKVLARGGLPDDVAARLRGEPGEET